MSNNFHDRFIELAYLSSPAFIIDQKQLLNSCAWHKEKLLDSNLIQLYPLKTNSLTPVLATIASFVDGFTASSLFECKLANEYSPKILHFSTPCLIDSEFPDIISLADHISLNSISSLESVFKNQFSDNSYSIRINPEHSLVEDDRYNPCKENSRLGIPISVVTELLNKDRGLLEKLEGVHFHTNCDSSDINHLSQTLNCIEKSIPRLLESCKWLNIGGGYIFDNTFNYSELNSIISYLTEKYGLQIICEPGASVVRESCYLVSKVVDIVSISKKSVAILDTSVNHMPEVFEYQFQPDILEEDENGEYSYILEGATCLAGDHFGEYSFAEPLEIGSRITFPDMGAYTMVKAHMFNGINLPSIYELTESGDLILQKQYTYEDFKQRCGASEPNESLRATANFKSITRKRGAA